MIPIVQASLFTGIGGFDQASDQLGWTNLFNCEIDLWCRLYLRQQFPQTKNYGNIHQLDAMPYRGCVDVLSGGFPCQPFSISGKKGGAYDPRYLFPAMHRVVNEVQSTWVIAENVRNILTSEIASEVVARMEDSGYEVWPFVLPASSVGAWHERYRTFFLCYSEKFGLYRHERRQREIHEKRQSPAIVHPNGFGHQRGPAQESRPQLGHTDYPHAWQEEWPTVATRLCRMAYGVPDRKHRIKALGNAVVVPLIVEIFKGIQSVENQIQYS